MHAGNYQYNAQQDCSPYDVDAPRPRRLLPIPPVQRNIREREIPCQYYNAQRRRHYLPEIPSEYSSLPRNFHNHNRYEDDRSETSSTNSRIGRRLPDIEAIRNLNYRMRANSIRSSLDRDRQENYDYPSYPECTSESFFYVENVSKESSDLESHKTVQESSTRFNTERFKELPKQDNKCSEFFLKYPENRDNNKYLELCCLESVITETTPEQEGFTKYVHDQAVERPDNAFVDLHPQTGYRTSEYAQSLSDQSIDVQGQGYYYNPKRTEGRAIEKIRSPEYIQKQTKAVIEIESTKKKRKKGFLRNPLRRNSQTNMSRYNDSPCQIEKNRRDLSLDNERKKAMNPTFKKSVGIDDFLDIDLNQRDNRATDNGEHSINYYVKRGDRLEKLDKSKLKPLQLTNTTAGLCQSTYAQRNKELLKENAKTLQLRKEPSYNKALPKEATSRKELVPDEEPDTDIGETIRAGNFDGHKIRITTNDFIKLLKPTVSKISDSESVKDNPEEIKNLEVPRSRQKVRGPQAFSTLAVSIAPYASGLSKGYSSPAIASFQSDRTANPTSNQLHISDQEASWIASISFVGAFFGGIFGGVAMRYGRKRVLLAISLPFSISWMVTFMASSVYTMCCSSLIGGFCCSVATMVSQVYISEIADSKVRGFLSSILKIVAQLGMLTSYIIGAYANWRQLALFISVPPILMFIAIFYVPETPSYLMLSGKEDEAYKSLAWFKRSNCGVDNELDTIRNNLIASKKIKEKGHKMDLKVLCRLIKPIWITCSLMFFQRFSGAQAFSFYAVPIFRKTFVGMDPHGAAIAVGIVQLFASCLSGLLVDSVGRVPLLMGSSIFMSISSAAFGSYIYYEETHKTNRLMNIIYSQAGECDWVPLICVLVFMIAFSMGLNPISWLLVSEIFPLEYRGFGTAFASAFSYLCAFATVKTFVDFQEVLGLHGTFWLYAFFSLVGLTFTAKFVPETRAKNLEEMDPTSMSIAN